MSSASRPDPWERQPDESAPAFEAFATYRDMGLTRSTARVARELSKSKTLMDRWSRTHSWVIRATSYDQHEDRIHRLKLREARRRAAERNLAISQAAMGKIGNAILALKTEGMDAGDIARLMEAASKLERLTLGDSTENIAVSSGTGAAGAPDVAALTDEERRARMEMLRRELNSRLNEDEGVPA